MFFDNYLNIDAAHVLDFQYIQQSNAELAFLKIVNVNAANRSQMEIAQLAIRIAATAAALMHHCPIHKYNEQYRKQSPTRKK